jgi:hypothetical protein
VATISHRTPTSLGILSFQQSVLQPIKSQGFHQTSNQFYRLCHYFKSILLQKKIQPVQHKEFQSDHFLGFPYDKHGLEQTVLSPWIPIKSKGLFQQLQFKSNQQ